MQQRNIQATLIKHIWCCIGPLSACMNCIKVRIYLKEMVEPETEHPWLYQQFSKVSIVSIGLRWENLRTLLWTDLFIEKTYSRWDHLKVWDDWPQVEVWRKNTNIFLALTLHSCFQREDGHNYPDNLSDKWVTKKAEKTLVSKRLWRFMTRLWLV